jgi:hypothetical protein
MFGFDPKHGSSILSRGAKFMRIGEKFLKMCQIYRIFAKDWENCVSFDDDMLMEAYIHETHGGPISPDNGFALGKKWLNLQVKMWKEDIHSGLLLKKELYDDGKFPPWWLDSVLK